MKYLKGLLALITGGFALYEAENIVEHVDFSDGISSALSSLLGSLFPVLANFFSQFLGNPKSFFINLGAQITDSLGVNDFSVFSNNFLYWFIGVLVGIALIKYAISVVVELISKVIDVT